MAEIRWTAPVERAAFRLPALAKADLRKAVAMLRVFPESGRLVSEGRYRGKRRIPLRPHWHLYYSVSGRDRSCTLIAIRDARRRPP
jgi:plasmid stabilization system protein ParE